MKKYKWLVLPLSIIFTVVALLPLSVAGEGPGTFYVSKDASGLNDGSSWQNAWSELDQINWSVVAPGDTILIDGGATSMTYITQLKIGKSGTESGRIYIKLATEDGRNGQAIFYGGRSTPLPECGSNPKEYVLPNDLGRSNEGISFNDNSYITVDGSKWKGIVIHGCNNTGVMMSGSFNEISGLEIYDNGGWGASQDSTTPCDGSPHDPGVWLAGPDMTVSYCVIYDNGEDSIQDYWQSQGGVNFKLFRSWLYDSRKHSANNSSFNWAMHNDGIQFQDTTYTKENVTISESIIGPGFMQTVVDGPNYKNVKMSDSLFVSSINEKSFQSINFFGSGSDWIIDHMTIVRQNGADDSLIDSQNTSGIMSITSTIGVGAKHAGNFPAGVVFANNFSYGHTWGTELGKVLNPGFVSGTPVEVGANGWNTFDFTPTNAEVLASGAGTYYTSVDKLLNTVYGSAPRPELPIATPDPTPTVQKSADELFSAPNFASVKTFDKNITGIVTNEFDVVPLVNNMDGVIGYADSSAVVSDNSNLAICIWMNTDGNFQAMDKGWPYKAEATIPYSVGNKYHVKVVADVPAATYNVWITPPGGVPIQLAADYGFRTSAPGTDDLGKLVLQSSQGNDQFKIQNHTGMPEVLYSAPNFASVKTFDQNITGTVTNEFDVMPLFNNIDGVIGYADSSTVVSDNSNLAICIWMNTDGNFQAMDKAWPYKAEATIPYTAGNKYHVKVVANVPAATYDVWITPPGGEPIQLAANYGFRTSAPGTNDLGKLVLQSSQGNDQFIIRNHTGMPEVLYSAPNFVSVKTFDENITGMVTNDFDVVPLVNNMDGVIGYTDSSAVVTGNGNLAICIWMNPDGNFQAMDKGWPYNALATIPYSAGNKYHVKVVARVPAATYDVWITPPGGEPIQLAANYGFRTSAPGTDDLGKLVLQSSAANDQFEILNHIGAAVAYKSDLTAAITAEIGSDHTNPVYVLDQASYTAESWDAYTAAIADAISVEGNGQATQDQVNAAKAAIATAKGKLVSFALSIGDEKTGGAGHIRTITIGGTNVPEDLSGFYLVVQFAEGTGLNAKVSVVMIEATNQNVTVSYPVAGTVIDAWFSDGMPNLTGQDMGVTIYTHATTASDNNQ